ncbi:MAG: hypothetical protein AAFR88_00920 [Pseudomonadota bacterium]
MKRNTLLGAVALASLVTLSACGGGADAPAEEAPVEETAAVEEAPAEEAAAEEAAETVEAVPAAEANGTVIEINMYTRDPDDSAVSKCSSRAS